jgi:hypothetical protein
VVNIPLPFPFYLYGVPYTNVGVSSNGVLQFQGVDPEFNNICLPYIELGPAIFAYWDDLDMSPSSCGPDCGIYVSESTDAPGRYYAVTLRAARFDSGLIAPSVPISQPPPLNLSVRLYEPQCCSESFFDIFYGDLGAIQGGSSATIGVQRDGSGLHHTEYSCNTDSISPGTLLTFRQPACPPNTPTSTPTATPSNTPGPFCTPILRAHATLQGPPPQPSSGQQGPITITLKSGTTEMNFPTQNTDSNGIVTYTMSSVPFGFYEWRAKSPKYLATSGMVGWTGACLTPLELGLLRAGDCNNDNVVNTVDFNILKATLGKALGDPGYDARADFTNDNVVNITDYNLLKINFGLSGSPPLRPNK